MKSILCFKRLCLVSSFALTSTLLAAQKTPQQLDQTRKQILADENVSGLELSDQRQTPALITFNTRKGSYQKAQALSKLSGYLNLRGGMDELRIVRQTTQDNSLETIEYQQYFKGIKVEHARYKALIKGGKVQFFNGAFYNVPAGLSTTPSLVERVALERAKASSNARLYAWEAIEQAANKTTSLGLKAALYAEYTEYVPKGELVVMKDFTTTGVAQLRLAYKFNVYAAEPLSRAWVYIDAQTGKILLRDEIIKHIDKEKFTPKTANSVNTTVQTRYAGTQQIKVKRISGNDPNSTLPIVSSHPLTGSDVGYVAGSLTYVLIDDTRGNGIETYDLNALGGAPVSLGPVYTLGKSFTDVDNNWTLAEHKRGPGEEGANEAENDDIAWDAHWGAGVVYDYWLAKHNRLSYDGNNAKIKSFIHYGPAYDNAFWNGTAMTYGDGSGTTAGGFKALTSLDVCGHEIGHGVCTFTSDLVYEKESGAMNEGFSDIWAACIEHYAKTVTGVSVAYRPFYIGEQIGANFDAPLRRMDNPKGAGSNPDTYGGANWQDPNCTPSLANDQCGVHTNSGVLNKWFFLVTAGSKNGTRPAEVAAYYRGDSDDELKDNGAVLNSIPYTVNGLGFDVAEDIAFVTETMLTSTATFAEARSVSIEVAKALTGDACSAAVESVTNAWFAVGVGAQFVTPCTTTFGFGGNITTMSVTEAGIGTDCNRQKLINLSVFVPANTTYTYTLGGSATSGKDYLISPASLVNNTASNTTITLTIAVLDDAVVEGTETVTVTLSGGNSTSFTINITDNDVLPKIGAADITLINENFDGSASDTLQPSGWAEFQLIAKNTADPTATTGTNEWGRNSGALTVFQTLDLMGAPIAAIPNSYNVNSPSRTVAYKQSKVDARGLNNLRVKFDFTAGGELDPAGTDLDGFPRLDYIVVAYSFDGVVWEEAYTNPDRLALESGTFNAPLPEFLNNAEFYIGILWNNDPLLGTPIPSATVDNFSLTGTPRKIETETLQGRQENLITNGDVYFYSDADAQIITKVHTTSSADFGCVNASLIKGGNGSFELYADGPTHHYVADKVMKLYTTQNAANTHTVSLYFTDAELAALTARGFLRNNLYIYNTTGASYTSAATTNTVRVAATYEEIAGVGGIFTATFTGVLLGDYSLGNSVTIPLPVTCLDFTAIKGTNQVALQWKVADERTTKLFEVQRSTDGINFFTIGTITASVANGGMYQFADRSVAGLTNAYYRLKEVETTGATSYLCTVLYVTFNGRNAVTIGSVYPNPGDRKAYVMMSVPANRKFTIEYRSISGQLINRQMTAVAAGTSTVPLQVSALASGSYMIQFRDEEGRIISTQQYIKR